MPTASWSTSRGNKTPVVGLLDTLDELPSIPEALLQILKIIDDPQSNSADLAKVIRLDAPLTSKILRLANSPYFSGNRHLANIQACIGVLGYRTVRQVAVCVSVARSIVSPCKASPAPLDYRELWRHSVVVGVITKHIANMKGDPDPEELFTAGLLHDLGKFVLLCRAAEDYANVVAERKQRQQPLVQVETELMGFDHTQAGEALCKAWRFPEFLAHCLRHHHARPQIPVGEDRNDKGVAWIRFADGWAHELTPPGCDLGFETDPAERRLVRKAAELTPADLEANQVSILEAVRDAQVFLDMV